MKNLAAQKEVMIHAHLAARGITDGRVIDAMREVPREEFVPADMVSYAYSDNPLPIADGQTISQPFIVAYMIQALEVSPEDTVLEIGTGSGYSAAVMSRVAGEVYSVERLSSLAASARTRLQRLGYANVHVRCDDGTLGWQEHAPYDAIVVTAGSPDVPEPLLQQLAVGGRLVIPVGETHFSQTLIRMRRLTLHDFRREYLTEVRFVPLVGTFGWKQ